MRTEFFSPKPTRSLFIVIEGLDGSGKTTAAKALVAALNERFSGKALFTYEPNDPSCGGAFIRQVLRKEISVSPRTLGLAYAANRSDHGDRVVGPWLEAEAGRIVVCDRYYLSSLVYNSGPDFPMPEVMAVNGKARRPDVFFFLDASDEVCRARMQKRNLPPELFEERLSEMRRKYAEAIAFLQTTRQETIVPIDGSGTTAETVRAMLEKILETMKA